MKILHTLGRQPVPYWLFAHLAYFQPGGLHGEKHQILWAVEKQLADKGMCGQRLTAPKSKHWLGSMIRMSAWKSLCWQRRGPLQKYQDVECTLLSNECIHITNLNSSSFWAGAEYVVPPRANDYLFAFSLSPKHSGSILVSQVSIWQDLSWTDFSPSTLSLFLKLDRSEN